jgi:hypothetical protein
MNAEPSLARPRGCSRPLWDGESCIRCGRIIYGAAAQERPPWTTLRGRTPVPADLESGLGPDWPTLATLVRLFGSLPAALDAAARRS